MTAGIPFGRYRLEERIGAGSLTEAFRAKSFGVEGFEKSLVIKRLLPEHARDSELRDAFVAEARQAVRLSHANVVQVFDLGRVEDAGVEHWFLATELVGGRNLVQVLELCRRAGGAPIGFALFVAAEVAKALDHAHRRRGDDIVVHGDVSARSVLLSWDGEIKLSDFGLARALYKTARGPLADDPRLARRLPSASPELARGHAVGPSSDIFSLGTLMYELLAGRHPFWGPTPRETLENIAVARFHPLADVRSDVPTDLVAIVERALAQSPGDRHESMAALYEELMAEVYATGARFDADDLIELLAVEEEPFDDVEPEDLVEQTRTDLKRSLVPPAVAEPDENVIVLKGERELSLLVLRMKNGDLPPEGHEHTRQVLVRYGGHLLADVTGEVAALFGVDAPDGRDTEHAVRAALVLSRMLSPFSEPQIGIDIGVMGITDDARPILDERVDRIRLQARRLATLTARQVVVSTEASKNLRGIFVLEPAIHGMKGQKVPLRVGESRAFSDSSGRFVGRKKELIALGELMQNVNRGELAIVGLAGANGVGKTRFLYEAARRLKRFRIQSYIAQCPPRGRSVPESALTAMLFTLCGVREGDPRETVLAVEPRLRALGLVSDEVDAVLTALGAPSAASAAPLSTAIASMFESLADDQPHVFAWDNAHEVDPESAAALERVVEKLKNERVMLVFAGRPDPDAPCRTLAGYTELVLDELEDVDVKRLIGSRLGVDSVPDELHDFVRARAGGHPMFVEELLREARDCRAITVENSQIARLALDGAIAVPRPLRALLAERVRRLPESERRVLLAAVVLGAPVDVSVLGAMLDLPVSRVSAISDALVQKHLLTREGPVTIGFGSLLLPEIVQAEIAPDALAELHAQAAEAYPIALGPESSRDASRMAHHASEAGAHSRAARHYATSGYHHLQNRRLERAVSDFVSALEEARNEPLVESRECIAALGRAARHVRGGTRLALITEELTRRLLGASEIERVVAGKIAVDLALIAGALSRYEDAEKLLEHALASSDPELARAALMARSEHAIRQGEFKRALAAIEQSRRFPSADDAEAHRRLVSEAQALAGAGQHDEALGALDRAEKLAGADDGVESHERAKVRALIHGFRGEWQRCAEASAEAAEQARSLGLSAELAIDLHNQGDALLRLGDHPRAFTALMASLSAAERAHADRLVNLNRMLLAYLEAISGSDAAKSALLQAMERADRQKWTWDALAGRTLHARILAKRGDKDSARRELLAAREAAAALENRVIVQDCTDALQELA